MAVKIPQNITREDKLVGPLTLKQFLYILGGGALSFVAYQYYIQRYIYFIEFILISLLCISLALALAFAKINGRPFIIFLLNIFLYIFVPKKRLWVRDNRITAKALKLGRPKITKKPETELETEIIQGQVEKLARILDTGGKMDIETFSAEHEINTLSQKKTTPEIIESKLEIEDILAETET